MVARTACRRTLGPKGESREDSASDTARRSAPDLFHKCWTTVTLRRVAVSLTVRDATRWHYLRSLPAGSAVGATAAGSLHSQDSPIMCIHNPARRRCFAGMEEVGCEEC